MKTTYRSEAEKKVIAGIYARIREIESTDRKLIGSDEGTHAQPRTYRLYEEISGEKYATTSFGGNNATRCTIEEAIEAIDKSQGRLIWFGSTQQELRDLRKELTALKEELKTHL